MGHLGETSLPWVHIHQRTAFTTSRLILPDLKTCLSRPGPSPQVLYHPLVPWFHQLWVPTDQLHLPLCILEKARRCPIPQVKHRSRESHRKLRRPREQNRD